MSLIYARNGESSRVPPTIEWRKPSSVISS
jgi:hypothetical protein